MRDTDRTETEESTDRPRLPLLDRRSILRAVGAGTALSAAGAAAAQTETDDAGDETPTETETETETDGDAIDPTFGYPALADDDDPPAEPDHVVEIMIQPREGAPIPEFFFQPTGLSIEPGDTVQFSAVTPHHTVTAYHPAFGYAQRVPDGAPPFSSPVLTAGGYWLYTFEEEGVYDFHCAPHEVYGHVGRIVVGEDTSGFEPVPDPCGGQQTETATETETVTETASETETESAVVEEEPPQTGEGGEGGQQEPEPPRLTATTVLRDPALDPENIVESGSVRWEELAAESKQLFIQISGFPPCGE